MWNKGGMMERNGSAGSPHRRPAGVYICGILMILFIFLFFFASYTPLTLGLVDMHPAFNREEPLYESAPYVYPSMSVGAKVGIFAILVAILFSISAIGLFTFKSWARKLALFSAIIAIAAEVNIILPSIPFIEGYRFIVSYEGPGWVLFKANYLCILFPLLILFYLTRPKVKDQFERQ